LHKMVEEKNVAKLVASLSSCSVGRWSSSVATQFKTLNITTLTSPTTAAPKVIPSTNIPSSMITLEQVKQMMEEHEVKLIYRFM
jgi:uncharacterized protein YbcI